MIEPNNPILSKMLERLFSAMVNGPSMNCRPHASRQRVDFVHLSKLRDITPGQIFSSLLGPTGEAKLTARVPLPARNTEDTEAREAWDDQQAVRNKLRFIADDARTYEQDTGVHALNLGFPLLSLPPATFGGRFGVAPSRRVLAPIAFIPLTLTVKTGAKEAVEIGRREGSDIVIPNIALLAWLEQQTGKSLANLLSDDEEKDPWKRICEIVAAVSSLVELSVPSPMDEPKMPEEIEFNSTPKAEENDLPGIVTAAVLGLFPSSNQGLLRDTREMLAGGAPEGPIDNFVKLGASLEVRNGQAATAVAAAPVAQDLTQRVFAEERMIADADPCQARAVRLARHARGLVVHGPPGTGKSQTITNVISDHLARGQRVLFVCDKRTALDVVSDRLNVLGLGNLCAIIHDPQRDQRELYRSIREQLDGLMDCELNPRAGEELAKVDTELQTLHADLTEYHRMLIGTEGGPGSFHHLVGLWLAETGCPSVMLDEKMLQSSPTADLRIHGTRLKEVLERGEQSRYGNNPWKDAVGIPLADFLSSPMESFRAALNNCLKHAGEVDNLRDPLSPAYTADAFPASEAEQRRKLAAQLKDVLDRTSPADRAKWANRSAAMVQAAKDKLAKAGEWIKTLRETLDDATLTAATFNASADQLGRDRETLTKYLKAFHAMAAEFGRVKQAAPDADDETILRWLEAGSKAVTAALRRLESASVIARSIDATTLDQTLLARFDRARVDGRQITEWLAALNGYAEVAGKAFGIFAFGKKSAGEAVAKHFGITLNPETAAELREFLSNLQSRLDLQGIIENALGADTFAGRTDDEELLRVFRAHHGVLSALTNSDKSYDETQNVSVSDEVVPAINGLIATTAAPASKVLANYNLQPSPNDAQRMESALRRLEARARLAELFKQLIAENSGAGMPEEDTLVRVIDGHIALFDLILLARSTTTRVPITDSILRALKEADVATGIVRALHEAPTRALPLVKLEETLNATHLFSPDWLSEFITSIRGGGEASETLRNLTDRINSLEGVLRVRDSLAQLPPALGAAAETLLSAEANPADGYSAVRRTVLAGEIMRKLKNEPNLQAVDGHRLKTTFDRYRDLARRKQTLVREIIQHTWTARQQGRLLVPNGSRLNGVGADLRRRITGRGERSLRLRQVIAHGASVEGGDPLFELRPVWMASPETVAQLFPRQAIFDVIVFDEASQCRLEEALPTLTRAKRVVVSGDPKQLPPTRFFESAIASSDDEETDSDQELFEAHQGEIEDLLSAALGLDIHQCYLDVHYRSRNSHLIGFSNEQFYEKRLQAIPSHPRNRSRMAPLTLHRVDGVYDKRKNDVEANKVCDIVRDLLKRPHPPSIGIACFNLVQRETILERLEEMAGEDEDFANRLAEARQRGAGSSEALFVKNLENVQGDERDHLIISTTFGPDKKGKFRRNFGPVGKPGGGRRLNVLVTRAREHVHVITSIPRSAYASLPPVPEGQSPSGTWLLFAYLSYVEQLADDYETAYRILMNTDSGDRASVHVKTNKTPSTFAKSLAGRLQHQYNLGSDVHWGNEGFCVDVALLHPSKAEDVTVGILCDTTRYAAADDPVEWEVFRTSMLEHQGWKIHRVWTPHFFRDPNGCCEAILKEAEEALRGEKDQSARIPDKNAA